MKTITKTTLLTSFLLLGFFSSNTEAWSLFSKPTPQQRKGALCSQISSVLYNLGELKKTKNAQKAHEFASKHLETAIKLLAKVNEIRSDDPAFLAKLYDVQAEVYETNCSLLSFLLNTQTTKKLARSDELPLGTKYEDFIERVQWDNVIGLEQNGGLTGRVEIRRDGALKWVTKIFGKLFMYLEVLPGLGALSSYTLTRLLADLNTRVGHSIASQISLFWCFIVVHLAACIAALEGLSLPSFSEKLESTYQAQVISSLLSLSKLTTLPAEKYQKVQNLVSSILSNPQALESGEEDAKVAGDLLSLHYLVFGEDKRLEASKESNYKKLVFNTIARKCALEQTFVLKRAKQLFEKMNPGYISLALLAILYLTKNSGTTSTRNTQTTLAGQQQITIDQLSNRNAQLTTLARQQQITIDQLSREISSLRRSANSGAAPAGTAHTNEIETKCVICDEKFDDRNPAHITPCQHKFHRECLDNWIGAQRNYVTQYGFSQALDPTCPTCRTALNAEAADATLSHLRNQNNNSSLSPQEEIFTNVLIRLFARAVDHGM